MKTGFDVIRRAFFYWQFLAAFVLPAWLFVGWGLFGGGGWGFVGLLVTAPIVFIALIVIALIVYARPLVRSTRMVSWKDVLLYLVLHGSVIGLGFFGPYTTIFVVVAVLTAIVGFWLTLWELVTDGARSMRETMDAFEQAAQPPGQRPPGVPPRAPGQGSTHQGSTPRPGDDPDVIIIHEVRD